MALDAATFAPRYHSSSSTTSFLRSKARAAAAATRFSSSTRLILHQRRLLLLRSIPFARPQRKEFDGEEDFRDESDVEESDTMVLLLQLVRGFLRKASLRATRAARGMLPPVFSSDLIAFFVNGALLLTLLWLAKALLEVVSSIGSMIFLGILVVRSIWSLLVFMQSRKPKEWRNASEQQQQQFRASPS